MVGRPSGHRTWDGRPDVERFREEHIPRLDKLGSGKQRKGLPIAEVQERQRKMRKEEAVTIALLHRAVPARRTDEGLRTLSGEIPIRPKSVQKYLEGKFGGPPEDVSNAMLKLARALPPSELAEKAYGLYEKFRPEIPPGKKWSGASGKLDLDLIRKMASASL